MRAAFQIRGLDFFTPQKIGRIPGQGNLSVHHDVATMGEL
jgi:hypothetical protein